MFTADTPEGKFPVHNIVAKFPGTKDGIIVIASHYDTNYPLRNTSYVGANDGGSSSALLLEIANQLRGKKRDGYSVWLVWDDAEEAMKPETELAFSDDSLYGIRHLAEKWQADGTLKKIKAFLLADMIGDADLNIDRDTNSTPWLEDVVYEAATRLGYQSHFFARDNAGERRSHSVYEARRALRRSHRLRLRLQQCVLAHSRKIPSTSSAPRVWKSLAAPCSKRSAFSTRWTRFRRSERLRDRLLVRGSRAFALFRNFISNAPDMRKLKALWLWLHS